MNAMNRVISKFATSLMGLLGKPEKLSDSVMDNRCEDIREEMLQVLEQCGNSASAKVLANKIFHARNIEALWYMRAAILTELSNVCDENRAIAQLRPITGMFQGYLPASLAPKQRPRVGTK